MQIYRYRTFLKKIQVSLEVTSVTHLCPRCCTRSLFFFPCHSIVSYWHCGSGNPPLSPPRRESPRHSFIHGVTGAHDPLPPMYNQSSKDRNAHTQKRCPIRWTAEGDGGEAHAAFSCISRRLNMDNRSPEPPITYKQYPSRWGYRQKQQWRPIPPIPNQLSHNMAPLSTTNTMSAAPAASLSVWEHRRGRRSAFVQLWAPYLALGTNPPMAMGAWYELMLWKPL